MFVYSAAVCENVIYGGSFALARHVPQGTTWHPATYASILIDRWID